MTLCRPAPSPFLSPPRVPHHTVKLFAPRDNVRRIDEQHREHLYTLRRFSLPSLLLLPSCAEERRRFDGNPQSARHRRRRREEDRGTSAVVFGYLSINALSRRFPNGQPESFCPLIRLWLTFFPRYGTNVSAVKKAPMELFRSKSLM